MSVGQLFSLEDAGVTITLCTVSPGREADQFAQLSHDHPSALICKVFGRYDLALIEAWEGDIHQEPLVANYPFVTDIHDVVCFRPNVRSASIDLLRTYPLACIVFVKLDPAFIAKHGPNAEFIYLDELRSAFEDADLVRGPSMLGLSSVGWHEVVTIIGCESFRPVFDILLKYEVSSSSDSELLERRVVSSITYPCVNDGNSVSSDATLSDVDLFIRISCIRHREKDALRNFMDVFGDSCKSVSFSPGPYDITAELDKLESANSYIEKLWTFRAQSEPSVRWTSTLVSETLDNERLQNLKREVQASVRSEREEVVVRNVVDPSNAMLYLNNTSAVNELRRRSPTMLDRFVALTRTYNACMKDPYLQPYYEPVGTRLAEIINSFADTDDLTESAELLRMPLYLRPQVELCEHAISQRLWGTPSSFPSPVGSLPLWAAGIHRCLAAAEYVVRDMVAAAGQQWNGFVVAGFTGEFHNYPGDIVDLPWEWISRPEHWLGLLHEAGHIIGALMGIPDRAEVERALPVGLQHDDVDELVWETFADICVLEFGYGRDNWRSYLRNTWREIQGDDRFRDSRFRRIQQRFFQRWLLTYSYYRSWSSGRVLASPSSFDELAQQLVADIVADCPALGVVLRDLRAVTVSRTRDVLPVVEVFQKIIRDVGYKYKDEADSFGNTIAQGKVLSRRPNSRSLVVHLASDGQPTARSRVALLLTLWNQAWREEHGLQVSSADAV